MALVIRELLWAIAALGGALIWFLWKTWDQGPLMEDLLGQQTLWTFVRIYFATILARITWSAIRAAARALTPKRSPTPGGRARR